MKIEDKLFTKTLSIITDDVYSTATEVASLLSNFGKLEERKNIFETDGPRKRLHQIFVIVDQIDDHYNSEIRFDLSGESNGSGYLEITISGTTKTSIEKGSGIASSAFSDFYVKNIIPNASAGLERKIKHISGEVEKGLKNIGKK